MRQKKASNSGDEPYNQLLVALFPDDQLTLLPFHRRVRDCNGLSEQQIVKALDKDFTVEKIIDQSDCEPADHGQFILYFKDSCYKLIIKPKQLDRHNVVNTLDVSILQNQILGPILGIKDSRDDPRLGYVAGVSGQAGIHNSLKNGWDLVFACYPTSIKQLMQVADADALMPPKSTYFDPKPRSGIFVRLK